MRFFEWTRQLYLDIAIILWVQLLRNVECASTVTSPTTTDPPTTTGTIFTFEVTAAAQSSSVKFTSPEVYGPVAGGAALLAGGIIAALVIWKKGLLASSGAIGSMGAATGNSVGPQSTTLAEISKTKVTRSQVKPIKINVSQQGPRKPSINVIRIQRTTLSIHSIGQSKV